VDWFFAVKEKTQDAAFLAFGSELAMNNHSYSIESVPGD
jgi:hypothetical protein